MVPLNDNKQQHTTKTNHAKEAKEHCVRFAVVMYEWRREGKRREKREGGVTSKITHPTLNFRS